MIIDTIGYHVQTVGTHAGVPLIRVEFLSPDSTIKPQSTEQVAMKIKQLNGDNDLVIRFDGEGGVLSHQGQVYDLLNELHRIGVNIKRCIFSTRGHSDFSIPKLKFPVAFEFDVMLLLTRNEMKSIEYGIRFEKHGEVNYIIIPNRGSIDVESLNILSQYLDKIKNPERCYLFSYNNSSQIINLAIQNKIKVC